MMRPTIAAMLAVAWLASPAAAESKLPTCDDAQVRDTFIDTVHPRQVYEVTHYKSAADTDDKRWCYAFFAGPAYGMGFMQAIFTLEWADKAAGRYWLEIKAADTTCRGVLGDPMSTERCK